MEERREGETWRHGKTLEQLREVKERTRTSRTLPSSPQTPVRALREKPPVEWTRLVTVCAELAKPEHLGLLSHRATSSTLLSSMATTTTRGPSGG